MLVLHETPAGYSLFKVNDIKKYSKLDAKDIQETLFPDAAKATKNLQLLSFQPFQDTADAVTAIVACQEGRVGFTLESFLKKKLKKLLKLSNESLAVADKALAASLQQQHIKGTSGNTLTLVHDDKTAELYRGIRTYMEELLGSNGEDDSNGVTASDLHKMQLGLSHSLGRYKLKFSADKVDTMVIQAVGLLDELDKEINTYAMRVKEWYGWHFPELQGLCSDNATYAKLVLATGHRHQFKSTDLTSIFDVDSEESSSEIAVIKEAAEISMGTDITDLDVLNIKSLAEQVLSMTEYRAQLFEYLKNRMNAIAPNLTILTGELVGARLISHAGSLLNLAKQPASTVQILGAEKALFRALKTKHDTPKYGLIYHASLIGQAAPKHKGKISRVLAAKASLAIRVDALTDETSDGIDTTVGYEGRAKVEARLRLLEGGTVPAGGSTLKAQKTAKYNAVAAKMSSNSVQYNDASDMQLESPAQVASKANADDENDEDAKAKKKEKKAKKEKRKSRESDAHEDGNGEKKRKHHADEEDDKNGEEKSPKKKKSKKEKKDKKEK